MKLERGYWLLQQWHRKWLMMIGAAIVFKQHASLFLKQYVVSKYLNFAKIKAIMYFAKFSNVFVKPRNLNFLQNKLYIWNLQITRFKMIYDMFVF